MNGQVPRDVIEYQLLADEPIVELEVVRGGVELEVTVVKQAGEPLGLEISAAIFDRVRTCDNHCEFCFIYQLPKGMRRNLYLKDDDYRLSFLYGNFTTLTRFTEVDLERVVDQGLSPLYVSIHATDPDVRSAMLRNPRGAMSLRWLRCLLDNGVEVHGQVVVCPGVNDAAVLHGTLAGVLDRFSELVTVAVVPLGVSRYSKGPFMRAHTRQEAIATIETVQEWQERFVRAVGRRVVWASDEYYLLADVQLPAPGDYEGFPQHENGVGMVRAFEQAFEAGVSNESHDTGAPSRTGFFAWLGAASQRSGVGLGTLLNAGLNLVPPAIVIMGIGVLAFGLVPRATSAVVYGYLGWSLFVVVVGGIGAVDRWVLDTSVFHQMATAPARPPDWLANGTMVLIGAVSVVLGTVAFNDRDIQGD